MNSKKLKAVPGSLEKPKTKKKEHYVNAKVFEAQIVDYYTTGNLIDPLADSVTKIAHGLSFAPNFINYSYKDEMVGDAVVKMFSALKNKKFKLNTGFSPFSYFTTIAFHAFINRIKKEKKYQNSINEFREKTYFDLMLQGNVYIEPTAVNDSGDGPDD